VHDPVLEHVPDGVRALARRGQKVRVIAIGEYGSAAAHDPVERARHPHLQAFHGAPQALRIEGLYDVVHVVALHREVHQAEAKPFAPARKGVAQGAKASVRAQVPDLATDPDGDVQRAIAELAADSVRDIGAR
jgi:hypothetical protein